MRFFEQMFSEIVLYLSFRLVEIRLKPVLVFDPSSFFTILHGYTVLVLLIFIIKNEHTNN